MIPPSKRSGLASSFLDADEWELLTVPPRGENPDRRGISVVSIPASYDSTALWNEAFWDLFPRDDVSLQTCARSSPGVGVTVDFPFRPTVAMASRYGPYPAAKMERIARYWRSQRQACPEPLAPIIATYEDHRRDLEAQRELAWDAFLAQRLPTAPAGYDWVYDPGGVTSGNLQSFRLWNPGFGFMPRAE